jgi:hypothetical protein
MKSKKICGDWIWSSHDTFKFWRWRGVGDYGVINLLEKISTFFWSSCWSITTRNDQNRKIKNYLYTQAGSWQLNFFGRKSKDLLNESHLGQRDPTASTSIGPLKFGAYTGWKMFLGQQIYHYASPERITQTPSMWWDPPIRWWVILRDPKNQAWDFNLYPSMRNLEPMLNFYGSSYRVYEQE